MDYSSVFVCLMGMGTVFFGLICLIALTTLLGHICVSKKTSSPITSTPRVSAPNPCPQELVAVVSAAIAEELGVDIAGIRILSIKKI